MPHPTPQPPAGRQVERIREILVGRQMEAVEQRLDRLESSVQPMPVAPEAAGLMESKLASLEQQQEDRFCRLRDEIDADRLRQLDETRRLAQQIQSVARSRDLDEDEIAQISERRMADWFSHWQEGLNQHLQDREDYLVRELRAELDRMREWMRTELASRPASQPAPDPSIDLERLRGAFEQLTAATHAITSSLPGAPRSPSP